MRLTDNNHNNLGQFLNIYNDAGTQELAEIEKHSADTQLRLNASQTTNVRGGRTHNWQQLLN